MEDMLFRKFSSVGFLAILIRAILEMASEDDYLLCFRIHRPCLGRWRAERRRRPVAVRYVRVRSAAS